MSGNLYDRLNKAMFDHPPMEEDQSWFVFTPQHSDFLRQLDCTSPSRFSGMLISENSKQRTIDRVWRVNFVSSKRFVCFVLEFLTRIDINTGLRIGIYLTLLLGTPVENKEYCPSHKSSCPDKWVQQGRMEGREEGRIESIRMVLHSQLEQKFGTIPESMLEKIESADCEQLERWTARVIGSPSLSQIFRDWRERQCLRVPVSTNLQLIRMHRFGLMNNASVFFIHCAQ